MGTRRFPPLRRVELPRWPEPWGFFPGAALEAAQIDILSPPDRHGAAEVIEEPSASVGLSPWTKKQPNDSSPRPPRR
jgi:hypothetical protein